MEREMGENRELNLFMSDGSKIYKPISLPQNVLEMGEDVILCGISTADKEPIIQTVAEPMKMTFSVDTRAIEGTLAFGMIFGKCLKNNWRKLHGLPMRRKKCLRR